MREDLFSFEMKEVGGDFMQAPSWGMPGSAEPQLGECFFPSLLAMREDFFGFEMTEIGGILCRRRAGAQRSQEGDCSRECWSDHRRLDRDYFLASTASAASTAATNSASSGAVPESQRFRSVPSLPIRNLPKFHFTSPGMADSLPVKAVYNGC